MPAVLLVSDMVHSQRMWDVWCWKSHFRIAGLSVMVSNKEILSLTRDSLLEERAL